MTLETIRRSYCISLVLRSVRKDNLLKGLLICLILKVLSAKELSRLLVLALTTKLGAPLSVRGLCSASFGNLSS